MKNFIINTLIFLLVLAGALLVGWHFIQEDVILYFTQVPIEVDDFEANLEAAVSIDQTAEGDELDTVTTLGAFDWIQHIGTLDDLEVGPIGELILPSIDVRLPVFHGAEEPNISLGAGTHRVDRSWDLPVMGEGNFLLGSHWDPNPGIRFGGLDRIRVGDMLILRDADYLYLYETIIANYVIENYRSDIGFIDPDYVWLTLFTCTPDGTQRVMVRGEFVGKFAVLELNEMLEADEVEDFEELVEVVDLDILADVVETLGDTEISFPTIGIALVASGALIFATFIVWLANLGSKKKK